jgi:hypothetical protein
VPTTPRRDPRHRCDASYALEVRNRHPGRFAVMKPVDPAEPEVGETIAGWKKTPGTVGSRIMMAAGPLVAPDDPGCEARTTKGVPGSPAARRASGRSCTTSGSSRPGGRRA